MKRWGCLLLCLSVVATLCLPAMAATETADTRLARVTEAVKATLDLDTERFTDFHGDVSEQELGTVWNLFWSGNGASLSVEALEDGTIVSYYSSDDDGFDVYTGRLPALPKLDAERAKAAANAFLAQVLDAKTEAVELGEPASANHLNATNCRFSGKILLNGLPSPLTYSISVSANGYRVTSFRRDVAARSFLGDIPSSEAKITKDAAAVTLRKTIEMELLYVTDSDNAQRAVLRYVPKDGAPVCVDAQTGELVNLSGGVGLYAKNAPAEAEEADMSADAGAARSLTLAEQEGIAKLEGVLTKEALEAALRGEKAYQLDALTLAAADYRLIREGDGKDKTETVLCTLRFTGGEDESDNRFFTVDARTAAVRSLSSWGRWDEHRSPAVSVDAAQKLAQDFLNRFTPNAASLALYRTDDNTAKGAPAYTFTFARKANDIFFPENSYTVGIDCMSGAVTSLSFTYDEDVTFDSPDGICSADAAADAWLATYDVALAYRLLPRKLNGAVPAEDRLIKMGFTEFYSLILSYGLEREEYLPGIDAKTGKPVAQSAVQTDITYSDLGRSWAKGEIEALAKYGVGYTGGVFEPDKPLTQWDAVCLLASAMGYRLDPANATDDERTAAYDTVVRMGALRRDERSDDTTLTRGALVKLLLNSAGYGPVAHLKGIFTCSYRDRATIPAEDLGYAALAQGIGLIRGAYNGSGSANRAMAAAMLYRLMANAV